MKKHLKRTSFDEHGWAHWIVPAVVVIMIAVIGVKVLTQSHAISTPAVVVAPAKQEITNSSNGKTVKVRPGIDLVVDLSNIYWAEGTPPAGKTETSMSKWQNFSSSVPTVLALQGKATYTLTKSTTSAAYNGTSTQTYRALAKGTAIVKASSISEYVCGAGIACPSLAIANYYTVTIKVAGKAVTPSPTCTPKPGYVCPD
jgi:hypothetical protein